MIFHEGLDVRVESNDKVSVSFLAALGGIVGASVLRRTQTNDDGVAIVHAIFLVVDSLTRSTVDHLEGVLTEVVEFTLLLVLVEATSLAQQLLSGNSSTDGVHGSNRAKGRKDDSSRELHGECVYK